MWLSDIVKIRKGRYKAKTKVSAIRFLMILSEVLIAVFVIDWIILQYKDREKYISVELSDAWSESKLQIVDSVLMRDFIKPALDSTDDINFDIIQENLQNVNFPKNKTTVIFENSGSGKEKTKKIIVNLPDSVHDFNGQRRNLETKNIVLRGIKLFASKQGETLQENTLFSQKSISEIDSVLLRTVFERRVSDINPTLKLNWKAIDNFYDTGLDEKNTYTIIVDNKTISAGVSKFNLAILKIIWPQVLFAAFLLLITTLAFVLSFKSLKTQIVHNEQRKNFIRNMSHELKTPVATVKVALESLRTYNRSNDPKIMDDYLLMALSETNRLESMVNRVMSISNENEDITELKYEKVDLKVLISEVIHSLRPKLDADQAVIIFTVPMETYIANIDELHIKGVLINLIENSLKYSVPPAEIEIFLKGGESFIEISVSDRGIGIPNEYQKLIFTQFFRVPSGDIHNNKGYGIGLYYSKLIVEQHGGVLKFMDRVGGGSIFKFTIPFSS